MIDPNNPFKQLETVPTSVLLEMSSQKALAAFQYSAEKLPFYKEILSKNGVNASSIVSINDFYTHVPLTKKEDIFPVFKAEDLCDGGSVADMQSAIVSSGTSGVFSYGILTKEDIEKQKIMVDALVNYYFPFDDNKILIINALPMGVSFVSSYPVIPTSVRPDIVIHIIKKFTAYFSKIVIITDPNFSKKILEDGIESGLEWKNIPVSFITGGAASSCSLQQYILNLLNQDLSVRNNTVLGTMGLTELGLNIFSTPTDLVEIRGLLQKNPEGLSTLIGAGQKVCPEIMYYFCPAYHVEVIDPDANGFGKIIVSNLDTSMKTPLIRYDTGDYGKIIDREKLIQILKDAGHEISLKLNLPLIAIGGRSSDNKSKNLPPLTVKEALFRVPEIAKAITGHFQINTSGSHPIVNVQLKKNTTLSEELLSQLQDILIELSDQQVSITPIVYREFERDVELNYENKWKHC